MHLVSYEEDERERTKRNSREWFESLINSSKIIFEKLRVKEKKNKKRGERIVCVCHVP